MTQTFEFEHEHCGRGSDSFAFQFNVQIDNSIYLVTMTEDTRKTEKIMNDGTTMEQVHDEKVIDMINRRGFDYLSRIHRFYDDEYDRYLNNIEQLNDKLSRSHVKPKTYEEFKQQRNDLQ